jgi:hypothetical protein
MNMNRLTRRPAIFIYFFKNVLRSLLDAKTPQFLARSFGTEIRDTAPQFLAPSICMGVGRVEQESGDLDSPA